MMRSARPNLLSLTEFVEIITELHPWITAQYLYRETSGPISFFRNDSMLQKCRDPIFEFGHVNYDLSRYEISRAIEQAENTFALYRGYWPAPKWTSEEINFTDLDPHKQSANLKYKYVQEFGVESLVLHQSSVSVTRMDTTGDGIEDEFQFAVSVPAGTSINDVAVFFTPTDRLDKELKQWEIKPVEVSIDTMTNIATVKGFSWCLTRPDLVLTRHPPVLAADDAANFVTEVDVYLRTNDSAQQGIWILDHTSCETAMTDTPCFKLINAEWSQLTVGRLDGSGACCNISTPQGCCLECNAKSERVIVNYRSGFPRQPNGRMDSFHAQIIAWLAASYLSCEGCACACGQDGRPLNIYRMLPGEKTPDGKFVVATRKKINDSKFGFRNGQVMAWEASERLSRINRGSLIS